MSRADLSARAEGLRRERMPFVLATVVRAERPTSAKPGDCALVLPDGSIDGFVGGACAETTVCAQGLRLLRTGTSTLLRITPAPTAEETVVEGMVSVANPCLSGGTLDIFLEAMIPPRLVRVFGAAPVARALVALGVVLGYDVRGAQDPADPLGVDADAVVVASHGRGEDAALRAALAADVPYVALVASRRRGEAVLAGLGLTAAERARVHTPAGLDIGAHTPPEIAVSIYAQLLAESAMSPRPPGRSAPVPPVGDVTDPVCGMAVAAGPQALRVEHRGRAWLFCGPGCAQAFVDYPDRYLVD